MDGTILSIPDLVVSITPETPGKPENGRIRAVLIKKNEQFGNFSPEYPVTLS